MIIIYCLAQFISYITKSVRNTGNAVILLGLVAGITLLGIFGQGEIASQGMNVLYLIVGAKIQSFRQRIRR
jgi:hypothetical protein